MPSSQLRNFTGHPESGLSGLFFDVVGQPSIGMFYDHPYLLEDFGRYVRSRDVDGEWTTVLNLEETLGTFLCQVALLTNAFFSQKADSREYETVVVNYGIPGFVKLGILIFDDSVENFGRSEMFLRDLDAFDYMRACEKWIRQRDNMYQSNSTRAYFGSFIRLHDHYIDSLVEIVRTILILPGRIPRTEFSSSSVPNPALGFSLEPGGRVVGTAGCITKKLGESGITLPLHAIGATQLQYLSSSKTKVYFQALNASATITSVDEITDSAFAVWDSHCGTSSESVDIMAGMCPRGYEPVHFEGASSGGLRHTYIDAWSKDLPFVERYNQLKVYTPAVTNPGDSGAALTTNYGQIVGFSSYRSGIGQVPEFSAWIWAESVFCNLGLDLR